MRVLTCTAWEEQGGHGDPSSHQQTLAEHEPYEAGLWGPRGAGRRLLLPSGVTLPWEAGDGRTHEHQMQPDRWGQELCLAASRRAP